MALLLLLLSPICFLSCEGANIKIINGHEAVPHSRPYMALIETPFGDSSNISMCCGTLLTPEWVLTAAHCNLIEGKTIVILGAHSAVENEPGKQTIKISKCYKYKLYKDFTQSHDIQLVQLSEKAKLGKTVGTLPLPETFEDLKKGTVCRVSGWGRTETGAPSDNLMETNIIIEDRNECKTFWKGLFSITTEQLCTSVGDNKSDSCKGDSGGPLICDEVLRGLNSFGFVPCGTPESSNVFTRLTKEYVEWIQETISDNSSERKSKGN